MAAGDYDSVFTNLPGSPRRPRPPPVRPNELMPVDPRTVIGGAAPALQRFNADIAQGMLHPFDAVQNAMALGTDYAGDAATWGARHLGLPNPELLGNDVRAMIQKPGEGGPGLMKVAQEGTMLAAPLAIAAKVAPEAGEAERIATGVKATKGLPNVAWDPAQQRWLDPKGKPITSSPLDIPPGGPTYSPQFDPNDPALAQRPAGVSQFDFPRAVPAKGPAVSARVADLTANEDVRNQVMDYVRQGQGIGDAWHNTTPILDSAVRALGPEAGQAAYQKFVGGFVGATSPQQKFPPNLRSASYYYWRDASGLPPMAKGDPIPPLYGHYVQGQHQQNVADYLAGSGNALADYDPAHPKPPSFNQNLLGNYQPVAVDMHAFKLPAMLSRDPRFLATGVSKGAPGYPDFNPREAVMSGQKTMDEAFANPTWWEDQPITKSEYPAMEQYWKGIGTTMGKDPAQAQAGGWIGGGGVTGLGSPPQTAAEAFQDRINNTAYRTGQTQSDVENNFWRGVHPLLSVGGGAALAGPPMLQQYWNAQRPQGAQDQGGAPQSPQFW